MPRSPAAVSRALFAICLAAAAQFAGCAGTQPSTEDLPMDFSLHAIVNVPPAAESTTQPLHWAEPQAYLLDSDGSLRALFGPGATDGRFPPIARRLARDEVTRLYDQAAAAGLLDRNHPNRTSSVETFSLAPGAGVTAVFDVRAGGVTRAIAIPLERDTPATRVIKSLAALTWRTNSDIPGAPFGSRGSRPSSQERQP